MKKTYQYNPFEIAFCGFSKLGKTTLICRLIEQMKERFAIGYLKSDAHRFEMDKKGKDTATATKSGAQFVAINSQQKRVTIEQKPSDYFWLQNNFTNSDILFIEGYKKNDCLPKIVFIDEEEKIFDEVSNLDNIIAFVGQEKKILTYKNKPYFHRDNIEAIRCLIEKKFQQKIDQTPIFGLILGGGESKRMGQDKCNMSYYRDGKSISAVMATILQKFTEKVYFSAKAQQKLSEDIATIDKITDHLVNFGPVGGIISAFETHPNACWLVIACDLPYIEETTIEALISNYNPYNFATAFKSEYDGFPEPLCTLYSPKSLSRFYQLLAAGSSCPRKMLINSPIKLIKQQNKKWLDNANTPQQASEIKKQFNKKL